MLGSIFVSLQHFAIAGSTHFIVLYIQSNQSIVHDTKYRMPLDNHRKYSLLGRSNLWNYEFSNRYTHETNQSWKLELWNYVARWTNPLLGNIGSNRSNPFGNRISIHC